MQSMIDKGLISELVKCRYIRKKTVDLIVHEEKEFITRQAGSFTARKMDYRWLWSKTGQHLTDSL